MKKWAFLYTFLFLTLLPVFSQRESAKEIISKVREHYSPDYSFVADFTFEIDYPESEKVITQGKLYIKGDKFRFVTENEEYISDNVNLWYWTKYDGINEIQISYLDDDDEMISPSDVFNLYLKGFAYKLITKTKYEGRDLGLIELVPISRDENKAYFKIKTIVDLKSNELVELQVFYKDGTVNTFRVSNEKQQNLSDFQFKFDEAQHSDVDIIDLR